MDFFIKWGKNLPIHSKAFIEWGKNLQIHSKAPTDPGGSPGARTPRPPDWEAPVCNLEVPVYNSRAKEWMCGVIAAVAGAGAGLFT